MFEIQDSRQFTINELLLITKFGAIDVRNLMQELNIYDNMFMPCMSGNIIINDSLGLTEKVVFDGSEYISIDIGKDGDSLRVKKIFRIYKQSDRVSENTTNETYKLSFVSEEQIFSLQKKISQSYTDTYSSIALRILFDYLQVKSEKISIFEESYGISDFVVPNYDPLSAIQYCAKRSQTADLNPSFLFFENKYGYNYVSLNRLIELGKDNAVSMKFGVKNSNESMSEDLLGVQESEVSNQLNVFDRTKKGRESSRYIGFDVITKSYAKKDVNLLTATESMTLMNKNIPLNLSKNRDDNISLGEYDSKRSVVMFNSFAENSSYVKSHDPYMKFDRKEDYVLQRQTIFNNLLDKRIKLNIPGNFALTSGLILELEYPSRAIRQKGENIEDLTTKGKYVVISTRQKITYQKHETFIECATDSTENNLFAGSSNSQEIASDY